MIWKFLSQRGSTCVSNRVRSGVAAVSSVFRAAPEPEPEHADGEAVAVDSLFDDQRRKVHTLEKGESVSEASLYRLAKRAAAGRGMKEEL